MATGAGRSGRRMRILVVAVLVVALAGGGAVLATSEEGGGSGDEAFGTGDPVPESLELELFDGTTATFGELRGQPVVVNFFASWCPPCQAEMPDLEAVHQEVRDRVAFVGVAQQDRREAAERLAERTGVTYPLADDPDGDLFRAFGSFAMPTTVLIDAEGRFAERHSGILSASQLRDLIADASGGQAAPGTGSRS